MGFFKNLFGNKSEDDASATSKPDPEKTGDSAAQPAETKPEPPSRAPESRVDSEKVNTDSEASQKVQTPSAEQEKSAEAKEKSEAFAKGEQRRVDGPLPLNNVVQFKSVSVSSAPPTTKHHKVTPPDPPKGRSRDEARVSFTSRLGRESEPKVSRALGPTKSTDKQPNGLGKLDKEEQNETQQPRVRAFGKGPRESLPVSQSKAKVVGVGQSVPKSPPPAPQSLKEKLIASADAAASSRNGSKPKTEARVFRTAMMQAKEKSIPPKEPEIDLKSAVEWAFELASQSDDAESKAAKAVLEDEGKHDEIQAIFSELVQNRAKRLRDFSLELSLGLTPKKWVPFCRDTVESIAQAANTLKRTELADALAQFEQQLDKADQQLGPSINPSLISELNSRYAKLAEQMPESFGVGDTPATREKLLVESLLLQIPGVGRNIAKQIESKQMAKYSDLCIAEADEVARQVGIEETVANAIIENFSVFQKGREALDPESRIGSVYQKLGEVSQQLDNAHRDFCRADADDNRENKRNARRAQASASARIDVLLADIAELKLLKSLRPLPVRKKVEAIRIFLDETASQLSAVRESSPISKEVSG
jgi:hypothetical protein